jgi:hypothetical protein
MCCMSVCRELKETGQKYGVCGTLCHIVRTKLSGSSSSFLPGSRHQYMMRVASVGEARAVLCRRSGLINLSHITQAVSTVASVPSCFNFYKCSTYIEPVIFCYYFLVFFSESKS